MSLKEKVFFQKMNSDVHDLRGNVFYHVNVSKNNFERV
jgi:hypothetical protein